MRVTPKPSPPPDGAAKPAASRTGCRAVLPRASWRAQLDARIREVDARLRIAQAGQASRPPSDAPRCRRLRAAVQRCCRRKKGKAPDSSATPPPAEAATKESSAPDTKRSNATERPDADQGGASVDGKRIDTIEEALCVARKAIALDCWITRLRDWLTGGAVGNGWDAVHRAEAQLIWIEHDDAVRTLLPWLSTWMGEVIKSKKKLRRYRAKLEPMITGETKLDRIAISQILREVISANSEHHENLRSFRSLIREVTAVLAAVLIGLGIWQAMDEEAISIRTTPSGANSAPSAPGTSAAADPGTATDPSAAAAGPSSDPNEHSEHGPNAAKDDQETADIPKPAHHDNDDSGTISVFEIELFGALGGLLGIASIWGDVESPPSRYSVRPSQMALKIAAGAASGLAGVMLVQSSLIISSAGESQTHLLVYALLFGSSQQLLTRFVDQRANKLLN